MNEELLQRAIEAAAKADYEAYYEGLLWENDSLAEKERYRAKIDRRAILIAFATIADHCDERDAELIVAAAVAESEFEARCCRRQSIELRHLASELRETS